LSLCEQVSKLKLHRYIIKKFKIIDKTQ
jgi:hypothetical protein